MSILVILAGLMGASGVILAAAGAHMSSEIKLDSAGYLLLIHAPAILGGVAALDRGLLWRPLALAAFAGFALGSALFAGDLALRAFAGHRLFPMAAPTGGTILIASWLAATVAAAVAALR